MKELINYHVYAKPAQYESVMTVFYDMKIFPMEEDPVDLKDFIENFNFSETENGLLKFFLRCTADSSTENIAFKLRELADYDAEKNLPRLELG